MGSPFMVRIDVWDGGNSSARVAASIQRALSGLQEHTGELEQSLSRFRDDSELTGLNRRVGETVEVSETLREVLVLAQDMYDLTEGAFDPRVITALEQIGYRGASLNRPATQALNSRLFEAGTGNCVSVFHPLDLGGIGKGYTADVLARLIEQWVDPQVLSGYIVDAGGDLVVAGVQGDGSPWSLGVDNPLQPGTLVAALSPLASTSGRTAVCTSATWRKTWTHEGQQVHHLIDPVSGRPAQTSLLSVTAVAPRAAWAEVATKYVFLRGLSDSAMWTRFSPKLFLVDNMGGASFTTAMEPYLSWLASS